MKSFGGFGDEVGRLKYLFGVVVDLDDVIYVVDFGNSRI